MKIVGVLGVVLSGLFVIGAVPGDDISSNEKRNTEERKLS
jgi:hypothetical protein